jgi:hypothetical protein
MCTLGLIDVTRGLWIKEHLILTPAELAGIGVWLGLPWTIKMVFGESVDSVPLFIHPTWFDKLTNQPQTAPAHLRHANVGNDATVRNCLHNGEKGARCWRAW